jgi:hypothetical protein
MGIGHRGQPVALCATTPQRRVQLHAAQQATAFAHRNLLELQCVTKTQTFSPFQVPCLSRRQLDTEWEELPKMVGTIQARRIPRILTTTCSVGVSHA